jgi:hypothetical protein
VRVFKKVHWSLSIGHWSLLIGTGGGDAALTRRRDAYATSKNCRERRSVGVCRK